MDCSSSPRCCWTCRWRSGWRRWRCEVCRRPDFQHPPLSSLWPLIPGSSASVWAWAAPSQSQNLHIKSYLLTCNELLGLPGQHLHVGPMWVQSGLNNGPHMGLSTGPMLAPSPVPPIDHFAYSYPLRDPYGEGTMLKEPYGTQMIPSSTPCPLCPLISPMGPLEFPTWAFHVGLVFNNPYEAHITCLLPPLAYFVYSYPLW